MFRKDILSLAKSLDVEEVIAVNYFEYRGSGFSIALDTAKGEVLRTIGTDELNESAIEVFNRWFGGTSRLASGDYIIYQNDNIVGVIGMDEFKYNVDTNTGTVAGERVSGSLGDELAKLR